MTVAAAWADEIPPWLSVMRGITGMTETPGDANNPHILAMADAIADAFPDVEGLREYCNQYQHDETPWCGLASAYAMAMSGILPPYRPPPADDTERFLWAQAWADDPEFGTPIAEPVPGCVVVMTRSGGGHVTLYESDDGSSIKCRGGNQGDTVNVSSYPKSNVIAYIWPKAGGPVPPAERRTIARGDQGSDVMEVQRILGLPVDGDFGPATESGVEAYQHAYGVSADGVVGPQTWAALDDLDAKMQAGYPGICPDLETQIDLAVQNSGILIFSWNDRGKAPSGYYAGMAKSFALALTRLKSGDAGAHIMAQADTGDDDHDALAWYADEFKAQEMDNSRDGPETLRHLFVMMIGLGMRESSGNHWCGRDMSASNVSSDTCEGGFAQTSWNISSCSSEIPPLLPEYWANPQGFRDSFERGCPQPSADDLDVYGSGSGARYQFLAKYSPAFHALVTAIGMRKLRQHWGPINRSEVQIVPKIDDLLIDVERLVDTEPGPPIPQTPSVTLAVVKQGTVDVTIEQSTGDPDVSAAAVAIAYATEGDVSVTVDEARQRRRKP